MQNKVPEDVLWWAVGTMLAIIVFLLWQRSFEHPELKVSLVPVAYHTFCDSEDMKEIELELSNALMKTDGWQRTSCKWQPRATPPAYECELQLCDPRF